MIKYLTKKRKRNKTLKMETLINLEEIQAKDIPKKKKKKKQCIPLEGKLISFKKVHALD